MNKGGVDRNLEFKIKTTAPILELKGSEIKETDKNLIKGTVFKGILTTRIIKIDKEKVPYKFIKLKDEKNKYVSPRVINLYVNDFASVEGEPEKEEVQPTALGEKKTKKGAKNFIINYGLPMGGMTIGYLIAKKKQSDLKQTAGYVVFFGLLGLLPKYVMKQ